NMNCVTNLILIMIFEKTWEGDEMNKRLKNKKNKTIIVVLMTILIMLNLDTSTVFAYEDLSIFGETVGTKEQIIEYYLENSPIPYPQKYISEHNITLEDFIDIVIEESNIEGLRADVAFAYIIIETEWLKFSEQENNIKYNFE